MIRAFIEFERNRRALRDRRVSRVVARQIQRHDVIVSLTRSDKILSDDQERRTLSETLAP